MNAGPFTFQCACLHWLWRSSASARRRVSRSATWVRDAFGRSLRVANADSVVVAGVILVSDRVTRLPSSSGKDATRAGSSARLHSGPQALAPQLVPRSACPRRAGERFELLPHRSPVVLVDGSARAVRALVHEREHIGGAGRTHGR